jgi:23S rRNA (cytidine1920-2'-O)/16S rRNA (cytidine1409-2'-O)-methyltransferase
MTTKKRLDQFLVEAGLAPSRSKAQAYIMAGDVTVNDKRVDKPGTMISADASVQVRAAPLFVSRGGEKLAGALLDFHYAVNHKVCADIGASTGGFTDCLLQNGAARVYAIDVGYGQLAHRIRTHPDVVIMERTNARYLEHLQEPVDLVVIDASFISLRVLLPVIRNWLKAPGDVIALIKPQFEVGRTDVGKGGVVRSAELHRKVIQDLAAFSEQLGYAVQGITISPLKGLKEGNTEFLIWLSWQSGQLPHIDTSALIDTITAPT